MTVVLTAVVVIVSVIVEVRCYGTVEQFPTIVVVVVEPIRDRCLSSNDVQQSL